MRRDSAIWLNYIHLSTGDNIRLLLLLLLALMCSIVASQSHQLQVE